MNALDERIKRFSNFIEDRKEEILAYCNYMIQNGVNSGTCQHLVDKAEEYIKVADTLLVLQNIEKESSEEAKKPKSDTPEYTVQVKVIRRKEKPNEN